MLALETAASTLHCAVNESHAENKGKDNQITHYKTTDFIFCQKHSVDVPSLFYTLKRQHYAF